MRSVGIPSFLFFHLNGFSFQCIDPVASEPYLKLWDVFYPFPIPCQSQTLCLDSFGSSGSCLRVYNGRIESCLNPVKCPDLAGGFDFCWSTWKAKMSHWSLKNPKGVVKIKMMCRRKGKLGQIVDAGSGRAIGSFGWLWGKQTLLCLHVLMGQGPKPLFSLWFLGSVAWFGCRVLFLWGRDTTVQQLCVSIVLCSTCCRTFSLTNGFQAVQVIPTLPPLCFQVTKNHYLKAFSSLRSVSTTISVCEGIFCGTKGQMYGSMQRYTCKWCNNLWILCPKLCKKQKPGSLGTGIAGALQEWRGTLLSWFFFVIIMSSSHVIDAAL